MTIDEFHALKKHTNLEAIVFENSIDCLYYGYGFSYVNTCGMEKEKAKIIFAQARDFLTRN